MCVAWLARSAVPAETPSARAPCLFWARHLVLCLHLGESEVNVCGPGGNPQASVVFASLPDTVLVHTHTHTLTHTRWQAAACSQRDLAVTCPKAAADTL